MGPIPTKIEITRAISASSAVLMHALVIQDEELLEKALVNAQLVFDVAEGVIEKNLLPDFSEKLRDVIDASKRFIEKAVEAYEQGMTSQEFFQVLLNDCDVTEEDLERFRETDMYKEHLQPFTSRDAIDMILNEEPIDPFDDGIDLDKLIN